MVWKQSDNWFWEIFKVTTINNDLKKNNWYNEKDQE